MKNLLKYSLCHVLVFCIPIAINLTFQLGNTYEFKYFIGVFEGVLFFYIPIYGLEKMKEAAFNRSEYKDPYEKTLTKSRVDIYIKHTSIMQLFFPLTLIVIPLNLIKYVDKQRILIILYVTSFITTFALGINFLLRTRQNVVIDGYHKE
ncbi:hypothetical protein [Vagococcus silagei]|uniref:Uncharacterized protein n=1 Tax=Vagococcus silagei TaxID=2508885 RepID=A0A4S3B500_9ENTE|nr:hypothetical protein [Vagococcus silagei]THB60693.1 hypothetical protein ESZ54_08860 [Vagococcus silagei]